MHALLTELYPICRSITGNGVRETFQRISEFVHLDIHEVPSGTNVFDWTVPDEWNVRAAWIKDPTGTVVVDFADHNLHLMSYSEPVHETLSLAELKPHLYSLPNQPELIPYRTSYYTRNWGFCLPHQQLESLPDGQYEVHIDSTLQPGSLTYAEHVIPGSVEEQILIFSHACHPSLANDNLSGLVVSSYLARKLTQIDNHYTYRFVFAPGTIGSIAWLAQNGSILNEIKGGLVAVLLGGENPFTYKKSRNGAADIDTVVPYVLSELGIDHDIVDFEPYGYDERQFGSPGIALDVGRLTRAPDNSFPEYHSSADNPEFVTKNSLAESLRVLRRVIDIIDSNGTYVNLQPNCEPQLGKRGLYSAIGGEHIREQEHALLWMLNQSDGKRSVLEIASRSGLPFNRLREAACRLVDANLLTSA